MLHSLVNQLRQYDKLFSYFFFYISEGVDLFITELVTWQRFLNSFELKMEFNITQQR